MKNLITVAILTIAISTYAQQPSKNNVRPDFTPEQIAELQTKKMTLLLELTETQQQQVLEITKRNVNERKQKMEERKARHIKGEKPTSEELFKRKNAQLDTQIEHQKEMKNILNEKQFDTWKKTRIRKNAQLKKRMQKRRMQKRLKVHRRQHQKIRR